MKVLTVIDHFGMGGAQRQIVELACGLTRRGHDVECFIYFPQHDFFRPQLEAHGVAVHEVRKRSGFSPGVVRSLASLLRRGGFDSVVSYLSTPNIYAEIATAFSGNARLVVSERTSHYDDKSALAALARRLLHGLADHVVTNSQVHGEWLRRKWWLRHKVVCIYNGLDLASFPPAKIVPPESADAMRLVGIGRVGPEKNLLNLIRALQLQHAQTGSAPRVDWVGGRDESAAGRAYCREVDQLIESLPEIRSRWHWRGVTSDVAEVLSRHHALIHPSFYEGLPNVVCEALATGVPVLLSDVCDHPRLVASGKRGFLFDPHEPQSIAAAINSLAGLDAQGWRRLSLDARQYAEANLGLERMIGAYEDLLARSAGE